MTTSENPDELIGAVEVAEILGITPRAVQKRVNAGTLVPAQKMRGRTGAFLFRRGDITRTSQEVSA